MDIYCFECKRKFIPNQYNVQIVGPDVIVRCPFCSYKYEGKATSFVRDQLGGYKPNSHRIAAEMIELAQYIELNSSEYYKTRGLRHGTKKVRNIPT